MRIGPRTRERAALICQVAASNQTWSYISAAAMLGIDPMDRAVDLAATAFASARVYGRLESGSVVVDAEAEALLRSGWSPGDAVVRR
jgi:hypothetical protein